MLYSLALEPKISYISLVWKLKFVWIQNNGRVEQWNKWKIYILNILLIFIYQIAMTHCSAVFEPWTQGGNGEGQRVGGMSSLTIKVTYHLKHTTEWYGCHSGSKISNLRWCFKQFSLLYYWQIKSVTHMHARTHARTHTHPTHRVVLTHHFYWENLKLNTTSKDTHGHNYRF